MSRSLAVLGFVTVAESSALLHLLLQVSGEVGDAPSALVAAVHVGHASPVVSGMNQLLSDRHYLSWVSDTCLS